MRPELYATHATLILAQRDVPFREAYRRVAEELRTGRFDAHSLGVARPQAGKLEPGLLAALRDDLKRLNDRAAALRKRVADAESTLPPAPPSVEHSDA
jgi:argininosuccinate lyase